MSRRAEIALVAILILAGVIWLGPWLSGADVDELPNALRWAVVAAMLIALFVVGRDQQRRDKQAETWVDNPRKSRLQNWAERRRTKFNPMRGVGFFFIGLIVFSVMIFVSALTRDVASVAGALAFVLVMSVLAGLIGRFTEKVPF